MTRGPLWQSRIEAQLAEDQTCLRQFIGYVHLNSVTAGLERGVRVRNERARRRDQSSPGGGGPGKPRGSRGLTH